MVTGMGQFLDGLKYSPCASDGLIAENEAQLGLKLPDEYVAFLKVTNGAEGFIGKNEYAILWKVEELSSLNRAYKVQEYAPGFGVCADAAPDFR